MRKYQKKHIKMLSKTLAKYIFTVRDTKAFIGLKDDDTYIEASVMLSGQYIKYRCFKKLKLFIMKKTIQNFQGSYEQVVVI
jgi:hypothetical protein